MRYRKRAVTVEATQWFKNGDHPRDYAEPVDGGGLGVVATPEQQRAQDWEGQVVRRFRLPEMGDAACAQCGHGLTHHGFIDTAQGGHRVCPGDWIVTLSDGETYPCKPDVFARHYEPEAGAVPEARPFQVPMYACTLCEKMLPVCDPCEHIDIEPSALASVRRQFGWKPA